MKSVQPVGLHVPKGWSHYWYRFRALRGKDLLRFFSEAFDLWQQHRAPRLGASVAFYTLLSLAPLAIIVVAVAGAVFGREAAEGQLVWQIEEFTGRAGAETVQSLLRSTQRPGAGIVPSLLGGLALIVGATSAVSELRDALNTVWCVPRREESGWRSVLSLLRDKGFAFIGVLSIGVFLLLSVAANTVLSIVTEQLDERISGWLTFLLQSGDVVVAFFVITALFAMIYKWMPDLDLEWRDVVPGAIFTSLLFSAGRLVLGLYLGRASYSSVYGAAGSLVVLLVWVYYSAQIFFFGAEFTRVWAQTFGSKPCDRIRNRAPLARPDGEPVNPPPLPAEPLVKLSED